MRRSTAAGSARSLPPIRSSPSPPSVGQRDRRVSALEDGAGLLGVVHDEGEHGAVAPATEEEVAVDIDAGVSQGPRDASHAAGRSSTSVRIDSPSMKV